MKTGIVNRIIPFSAVDGSGNRTAIFLQGCNFKCLNCHNPETINFCTHCGICVGICKSDALHIIDEEVVWNKDNCTECDECIKNCPSFSSPKTTKYTVEKLFKEIEKYLIFTSGITISGGECTLQYNFLLELLKKAKAKGISVFVDSNLYIEQEKLTELAEYFDKAMPDAKAFDAEKHLHLTGKSSELTLKNIEFMLQRNQIYEVRTVVIPEVMNNEETVSEISKLIAKYNPQVRYKLIKYRKVGVKNPDFSSEPTNELMQKLKEIAEVNGCENVVLV